MLKHLAFLAAPAILLAGLAAAPAQAQVGIEIGPRGVRVEEDRPRRGFREPRRERVIVEERRRRDCETVERRRENRRGEMVITRERVCR